MWTRWGPRVWSKLSVLTRLFDLTSLEDYFYSTLISTSRLYLDFFFCLFPKNKQVYRFDQQDCNLMLAILCIMICNLSAANSKNTHTLLQIWGTRCGLFGCLAVLIKAICTITALDLDPQCFPVLDGLHLASSVFPFSATSSCESGF